MSCSFLLSLLIVSLLGRIAGDAAYCYRRSSVVCRSVCLQRPWALQNVWTDRDAVCDVDLVVPSNCALDRFQIHPITYAPAHLTLPIAKFECKAQRMCLMVNWLRFVLYFIFVVLYLWLIHLCGLVVSWLGRWLATREVASATPGRSAVR